MAFKLNTSLVFSTPSVEYIEGELNENFVYGEAVTFKDGKVTKCLETEKPDFISLTDISCKEEGILVPVMRVFEFYIFECPIVGNTSGLSVGSRVALNVDATGVSTQTTNGVAQLLRIEGNVATIKF